jgi:hypothetical protein
MASGHRGDLTLLVIALIVAVLLLVMAGVFLLPAATPLAESMHQGMSLKEALPWGFGVTVGLLVLFAVVSGDGLIGELQFILGSFFSFFLILTLLIAWVF